MFDKYAVTVWKNGNWKVWSTMDATYARDDPDWLTDFGVQEVLDEAKADVEGIRTDRDRAQDDFIGNLLRSPPET